MTDWCGPTAELSNQSLAKLLHRARRTTYIASQKKTTDSSAPLTDPWFEDSAPQPAPEVDPTKPVEIEQPRERRERTVIRKITTKPVYPIYRGGTKLVHLVMGAGVVGAIVAAAMMF